MQEIKVKVYYQKGSFTSDKVKEFLSKNGIEFEGRDIADPKALEELHQLAVGSTDMSELRRRVVRSQKQRQLVQEAMHTGRHVPWDYQPRFDASKQYVRGKNLPVYC